MAIKMGMAIGEHFLPLIFKRKYSSLTINRISGMHFSNGKRNGVIWCNHKWNDTFAKSHQFNTSSLLNVSHQTFA